MQKAGIFLHTAVQAGSLIRQRQAQTHLVRVKAADGWAGQVVGVDSCQELQAPACARPASHPQLHIQHICTALLRNRQRLLLARLLHSALLLLPLLLQLRDVSTRSSQAVKVGPGLLDAQLLVLRTSYTLPTRVCA